MMTFHRWLAVTAAALGFGGWLVEPASVLGQPAQAGEPRFISAPELAARIVSRDPGLRVFDLRSRAEYDRFHVPGAVHATTRALAREAVPPAGTAVVYANRLGHATRGWAELSGHAGRDVRILRGGAYEWIARIHEPHLAVDATATERTEFEEAARFSRFFGGRAHEGVPRGEMPAGYWTGAATSERSALEETLIAVAAIRRRG